MIKNRIFNNAKWIIVCKIVQSLLQLIVGMLCARYLGPSNYGIINYAASIVAFVVPLMQLGLNCTLVQEFVEKPEQEGKIIGTALVLDLISAVGCIILVSGFVSIVNKGETETIIVCILYSLSLLFRALELLQCWFHYKLKSKYSSVIMLFAYIIVSIYRIYLLATGKNIFWFAVVNSIDCGIIGISLILIYYRLGAKKFSFSFAVAKKLFSRSKYYIISSMMITLFQSTDHIMLKLIKGDAENGFYTAAVTSAVVCQFVYTAVVDSMRPIILGYKKSNPVEYERNISRLYSITTYACFAQAVVFTIFAKHIIWILYGEAYLPSVPVLQVMVWFVMFSFMGSVRNIWILAEGKQSILWKMNLAGAIINISMNFALIWKLGALGAAIATLSTQILINFVFGFIVKPLRENNRLLLKGLNPKMMLEMLKMIKK